MVQENITLMNNNSISQILSQIGIVSYIIYDRKASWYIIPVDYWVMNHWGQWSISWTLNDEEKGNQFIKVIEQFKFPISEIKSYYDNLEYVDKVNFLPQVYADFDKKIFKTNFGEWVLEDSILDSWEGSRIDVKDLIPDNEKYWIPTVRNL